MIYEFACDECKNVFEKWQSMEEKHEASCPECKRKARRIYHPNAFRFDFNYGWDPGAGRYFDSARQRDNHLAEKGLIKHKSN
jgi:putative FmdB family regulatory protein